MNFTGGNTLPSLGRRLNWQIVALAGGLALAISVGALSGVFERDSSPATTATNRPAEAPISRPVSNDTLAAPSEMVYVIVGSQAEATALRSAISTDAATDSVLAQETRTLNVVALENSQQEEQFGVGLQIASAELMTQDTSVRVIDLRPTSSPAISRSTQNAAEPAANIVYVVGSEAEAVVLRQQFHEASATQVDTTRRNVFVADTPERQALLQTIIGEQMATGAFSVVDLR
jgi:hypothetical protein